MKRTMKRMLSLVLACILLLGTFSAGSMASAEDTVYKKGDIIEFGSYPQIRVTDEETLAALFGLRITWNNYGYYAMEPRNAGSQDKLLMESFDFMKYADVTYHGERYRAVRFTAYRPDNTRSVAMSTYGSSTLRQPENGFIVDTTYWFRYDPIRWRVLDPAEQLVVSESVLDAQPFSNTIFESYIDLTQEYYALNYEHSSVRAFLTSDEHPFGFWNTAFSESEQNAILTTVVDNRNVEGTHERSGDDTEDKVFLLSLQEAQDGWNWAGLHATEEEQQNVRAAKSSDYAKCQGVYSVRATSEADQKWDGCSGWILRTGSCNTGMLAAVSEKGRQGAADGVQGTVIEPTRIFYGVRPAMRLDFSRIPVSADDPLSPDNPPVVIADTAFKKGNVFELGSYPQSRVTDEETLAALFDLRITWQSYGYYAMEPSNAGSQDKLLMQPSDFMKYADVTYNGERYRAVRFTAYRPDDTRTMALSVQSGNQHQVKNGFSIDTTYWFRYDPIRWRVLDPVEQLVISESVLDTQPFSNTVFESYTDPTREYYALNYEHSSVRAFLTSDNHPFGFWNTAFSEQEENTILTTIVDNRNVEGTHERSGDDTEDKVFLLSLQEAQDGWNWAGLHATEEAQQNARAAKSTDYAKCQSVNCYQSTSEENQKWDGYSGWILRTGSCNTGMVAAVSYNGYQGAADGVQGTVIEPTRIYFGIRPAMRIDLSKLTGTDDKPLSGTCGENVQWAFDEESGVLSLSGTGAMDSLGAFADYGYSAWKDDIQFVAATDGVTAIGAHAFEGCPMLEEVILGEDVTVIGETAFTDCPHLMNVTLLSKTISANGAFPDDRVDWMLIHPKENVQAVALAKWHGVSGVPISYEDEILSFGGTITVHDGFAYSYLPMLVQRYGSAQKVYFNRLVFADVRAEDVSKQDYIGSDPDGCLTMFYVEVSLIYVSPDGEQREVTYDEMIDLLQSGDYRAFKLRVSTPTGNGDEKTQEEIIYEKLEEILPFMPRKVLRLVSKAINFIVSIFKKK